MGVKTVLALIRHPIVPIVLGVLLYFDAMSVPLDRSTIAKCLGAGVRYSSTNDPVGVGLMLDPGGTLRVAGRGEWPHTASVCVGHYLRENEECLWHPTTDTYDVKVFFSDPYEVLTPELKAQARNLAADALLADRRIGIQCADALRTEVPSYSVYYPSAFVHNALAMLSLGVILYSVPYRLIAAFTAAGVRRRLRAGRCIHCDYDLRGFASDVCPECGTPRYEEAP
jgi:hypothetical protein